MLRQHACSSVPNPRLVTREYRTMKLWTVQSREAVETLANGDRYVADWGRSTVNRHATATAGRSNSIPVPTWCFPAGCGDGEFLCLVSPRAGSADEPSYPTTATARRKAVALATMDNGQWTAKVLLVQAALPLAAGAAIGLVASYFFFKANEQQTYFGLSPYLWLTIAVTAAALVAVASRAARKDQMVTR